MGILAGKIKPVLMALGFIVVIVGIYIAVRVFVSIPPGLIST